MSIMCVLSSAASNSTKSLPEGFFDDPKKDAKARHVEYKDPMTEEWEKFQKSIQKEDDVRSEGLCEEGAFSLRCGVISVV